MAQVLVRNLDDAVVERLKARAAKAGRSLEAELRGILEAAAQQERDGWLGRVAAIRARTPPRPASVPLSEDLIREDRDTR